MNIIKKHTNGAVWAASFLLLYMLLLSYYLFWTESTDFKAMSAGIFPLFVGTLFQAVSRHNGSVAFYMIFIVAGSTHQEYLPLIGEVSELTSLSLLTFIVFLIPVSAVLLEDIKSRANG